MSNPTKRAYLKWDDSDGIDFLQLSSPNGNVLSWIDSTGTPQGNLTVSNVSSLAANVKTYGAKGDGSTDDTSAIQSALNVITSSGGTVYFPAGTYKVSSTLAVSNPTRVLGESQSSVTIKLAASSNCHVFSVTSSNVAFENITIDGTSASNSGTFAGITYSTTLSNFSLRSVAVINCSYHGIHMVSSSNVLIDGCVLSGSLQSQFEYDTTAGIASSNITIVNSVFDSTGAVLGAAVTSPYVCLFFNVSGSGATVSNIVIDGNTVLWPLTGSTESDGIVLDGIVTVGGSISYVVISNNLIACPAATRVGGQNSIEVSSVNNISITGNTLLNGFNGILVEGASPTSVTITGNTLITQGSTGNSQYGISALATTGLMSNINISGNTFSGWDIWCIALSTVTGAVVNGNQMALPALTTPGGLTINTGESVVVSANVVGLTNGNQAGFNTQGNTAKYLTFRGNIVTGLGTGKGFTLQATTHTQCVFQGNTFDNLATANNRYFSQGVVQTGITIIDDNETCRIVKTGQTTSIAGTNLIAVSDANFLYKVHAYLNTTTIGTGGTVTLTLTWNDGAAQTVTTSSIDLTTLGSFIVLEQVIKNTSGLPQFSTTVAGKTGSPQYSLDIRTIPLG